eukprot:8666228-Pyramimonas_sp.AAC.1
MVHDSLRHTSNRPQDGPKTVQTPSELSKDPPKRPKEFNPKQFSFSSGICNEVRPEVHSRGLWPRAFSQRATQ